MYPFTFYSRKSVTRSILLYHLWNMDPVYPKDMIRITILRFICDSFDPDLNSMVCIIPGGQYMHHVDFYYKVSWHIIPLVGCVGILSRKIQKKPSTRAFTCFQFPLRSFLNQ